VGSVGYFFVSHDSKSAALRLKAGEASSTGVTLGTDEATPTWVTTEERSFGSTPAVEGEVETIDDGSSGLAEIFAVDIGIDVNGRAGVSDAAVDVDGVVLVLAVPFRRLYQVD
jgi:hypothetical protein